MILDIKPRLEQQSSLQTVTQFVVTEPRPLLITINNVSIWSYEQKLSIDEVNSLCSILFDRAADSQKDSSIKKKVERIDQIKVSFV